MKMENRKVFNSAEQGNNEKYCFRKESQDYSKKGESNLAIEIKIDHTAIARSRASPAHNCLVPKSRPCFCGTNVFQSSRRGVTAAGTQVNINSSALFYE